MMEMKKSVFLVFVLSFEVILASLFDSNRFKNCNNRYPIQELDQTEWKDFESCFDKVKEDPLCLLTFETIDLVCHESRIVQQVPTLKDIQQPRNVCQEMKDLHIWRKDTCTSFKQDPDVDCSSLMTISDSILENCNQVCTKERSNLCNHYLVASKLFSKEIENDETKTKEIAKTSNEENTTHEVKKKVIKTENKENESVTLSKEDKPVTLKATTKDQKTMLTEQTTKDPKSKKMEENITKLTKSTEDKNLKEKGNEASTDDNMSITTFFTKSSKSDPDDIDFIDPGSQGDAKEGEMVKKHVSRYNETTQQKSFYSYVIISFIMIVILYLIFHNKQKIIALCLEGRPKRNGRRRTSAQYHKLDSNLDEVMSDERGSRNYKDIIY